MVNKMNIEPEYVAKISKLLRKHLELTQENLADISGVSTRTIEKIESGRHKPDLQTLKCIAKAIGWDVDVFRKPTQAEEADSRAAIMRANTKTILATVRPIRKPVEFLSIYGSWHARRVDYRNVEDDEALEVAVQLDDYLEDLSLCWEDLSSSDKLKCAKDFVELCCQLETKGYSCCMGGHQQIRRRSDQPDLLFDVGVVLYVPHVPDGEERYALIELDDNWERVEPLFDSLDF